MTQVDTEEQPLDPAIERVRSRMMRMMFISISILMAGILAVLFSVVFKVSERDTASRTGPDGEPLAINLGLEEDARVVSSQIDGNTVLFTVSSPGNSQRFLVVDLESGSIVADISER